MTNYEYYKTEIDRIARMGRRVAFDKEHKRITACLDLDCDECGFFDPFNDTCRCIEWAEEEYMEQKFNWYDVPIDTPILVKDECDETWVQRHFAGLNVEGCVTAWGAGKTSWSVSTTGDRVVWTYAKLAEVEE